MEIIQDVLTAHAQQWTDNLAVFRANTRQTMDARASKEVHEEGFDGIVAMMSHAHRFCSYILTK